MNEKKINLNEEIETLRKTIRGLKEEIRDLKRDKRCVRSGKLKTIISYLIFARSTRLEIMQRQLERLEKLRGVRHGQKKNKHRKKD